ncbi:MAG: metallophosphoesterase family protein [Bacteroidota bacterium]
MNKIAVISDVHGNYPALQAVLSDIDKRGINTVYCLGDLVGYYCMINEVIDEIRNREIPSIMGNHDFAMVENSGKIPTSITCTRILQRQLGSISAGNFDYLKGLKLSLSFQHKNVGYYCVHGGLKNNVEEYIREIDENYFVSNNFDKDVLISGHTHLPVIKRFLHNVYLNPGSVGQPRDGDNRASYMIILDGNDFELVRVSYDIDAIVSQMKQEKYEPYVYEGLYLGRGVGSF